VFGSIARGEEHRQSDIDLIVIGDVTFADVVDAVRCVERDLRREVNPSVYTQVELANKLAERSHFLTKVLEGKKLFLIGTQDELAAISRK
jgi:predicted nucleotidyltransferase